MTTRFEVFNSPIPVQINEYIDNYILTSEQKNELPLEMHFAAIRDISEIYKILPDSSSTDYVLITTELISFLNKYKESVLGIDLHSLYGVIPADIFLSKNIPLKDFVFRLDVYDDDYKTVLHNDYIHCVCRNDGIYFIYTRTQANNSKYTVTTCMKAVVYKDTMRIDMNDLYTDCADVYEQMDLLHKHSVKAVGYHTIRWSMGLWYLTQHLLLHPQIKELDKPVFKKTKKYKQPDVSSPIVSKKRKAKYVRYKELNPEIIHSDVLRKRHTMCWYVIGHYRTYKSGKKVWINGYWKGPLRDSKKNLDEGRERVLVS